jgi:hypothetical protein
MGLHISRNVMSADVEDFLVILDLKTEAYHILNPVGTSMWKALLAAEDEAHALQSLQKQYSVDGVRLKVDLENFRRGCLEQGFLQENEPEATPLIASRVGRERGGFLVLRAWWSLFRTARSRSRALRGRTGTTRALPSRKSPLKPIDCSSGPLPPSARRRVFS